MPRPVQIDSATIDAIIRDAARRIEDAVRKEIAARIDEEVAKALGSQVREARPAAAPKVTVLPPGPRPDRPKRAGPSMECRVPGCLTKSRGPRYEYFCADHFRAFNHEQRAEFTRQWKERKAKGPELKVAPEPAGVVVVRRKAEGAEDAG